MTPQSAEPGIGNDTCFACSSAARLSHGQSPFLGLEPVPICRPIMGTALEIGLLISSEPRRRRRISAAHVRSFPFALLRVRMRYRLLPRTLLALFAIVFLWSAVRPHDY